MNCAAEAPLSLLTAKPLFPLTGCTGTPRLASRANVLPSEATARLHAQELPPPGPFVALSASHVYQIVRKILDKLPLCNADQPDYHESRWAVLDQVKLLLGEVDALAEMLQKMLRAVGASSRNVKQIENAVKRDFVVPLNKIKHAGFRLNWLSTVHGGVVTSHGYYLQGHLGENVYGSASHRFGDRNVADGYSFACVLRRAVQVMHEICNCVEHAIPASHQEVAGQVGIDSDYFDSLLRSLNGLPLWGFPIERQQFIPLFERRGFQLFVEPTWLRACRQSLRYEWLTVAGGGERSIQMPFVS